MTSRPRANGYDVIASLPVERAAQPYPMHLGQHAALPRYSILDTLIFTLSSSLLPLAFSTDIFSPPHRLWKASAHSSVMLRFSSAER